ncbi:MAG: PD-(D/E)XK nuclease family protein [Gemmatimonadales bacterium]|jgi:hypothetical protein
MAESIESLLASFGELERSTHAERQQAMDNLLSEVTRLQATIQRNRAGDFNIFELLQLDAGDERLHTQILGWLLDETESHGQGNSFLKAFLGAARIPIDERDLNSYVVHTEFAQSEAIVDIAIYKVASFVVYVENKVYAAEGFDQPSREQRDMHRLGQALSVPTERCRAVWLSPAGEIPPDANPAFWRPVAYQAICREFEAVLSPSLPARVGLVVADWLRWTRDLQEEEPDVRAE